MYIGMCGGVFGMEGKSLSTFLVVGLVLLFVSGCWTVGSLAVIRWDSELARIILFASNAMANVSFLVSISISILGLSGIVEEEDGARRKSAYALVVGTLSLTISIIVFFIVLAGGSPWGSYD